MKRNIVIIICILVYANNLYSQKVGLVLSGGGAKGLAHIGVIRALEENEIPIDYITGTSMGAIIGALYASGYTTIEMEEIINSEEFLSWSTGRVPDKYYYFYKKRHYNASMLSFRFKQFDSITVPVFPTNIIPTHSMDLGLLELFTRSGAAAGYDFDSLYVPFRCVASDVHLNRQVILKNGDLASAVRASMTYPFFFNPIAIDGVLLFDGGIHNNFPYDVMISDFNPDFIIGSKTSSNPPPPTKDNLRLQIENMVTAKTDYDIEKQDGILIDSEVENIGVMDFHHYKRIIKAGYDSTLKKIQLIKEHVPDIITQQERFAGRQKFKDLIPSMIFQNIIVKGSNRSQVDYVIKSIRQREEYFTIERLRSEYYKLVSDDKIRSIYPRALYNSETGIFDLYLDLESEKTIQTQIGGNISSSNINQGFAGIEYKYLGRNSYDIGGNIYFGRHYSSVMARGSVEIPGAVPVFGDVSLTLNRSDYFSGNNEPFFEDVRPSYLIQYDGHFRIEGGIPVRINGITKLGYIIGRISDRYYQSDNFNKTDTTDRTDFDFNRINFSYEKNNLNYRQFSSRGENIKLEMEIVRGIEKFSPGSTSMVPEFSKDNHIFFRFKTAYSEYFRLNSYSSVGLTSDIVLSTSSFFNNYTATVLNSPGYLPIPHSKTLFLKNFRATSFAGVGIIPILRLREQFQLRFEAYIFQPYEKIGSDALNRPFYMDILNHRYFMGSASLIYHTPLGPASLSLNYYEKSGQKFYFAFNFGYLMFNQKALY